MLKILRAATFEVLETMFFLFPETVEGFQPEFSGPGLRASVPVDGPQPFRVELTIPLGLAREMAANFLGVSVPGITPEDLDDVMLELANMIVGAFLVRSRASAAFKLKPPELHHLELQGLPSRQGQNHLLLAVADYGLEISLELGPRPVIQPRGGQISQAVAPLATHGDLAGGPGG